MDGDPFSNELGRISIARRIRVSIGARRFGIGMGRAERIVQILEGSLKRSLGVAQSSLGFE